ncbi:MAG: flagellar hook basal-body protein [Pseudomonadota bacterium]|nr:flagellar hook basal-body protein [Pseudomonadota bacterium]
MISTIRNALRMANTDIAIISNNIANSGSTGFKRSDGNFLDSYAEDVPIPGLNVGYGVIHEEPRRQDTKQGALRVTNNSLDLAVSGDGMFVTKHPEDDEITFTRDGSFLLDIDGRLTTTDKKLVLNANGDPIVIPPMLTDEQGRNTLLDVINISNDGAIKLTYGDGRIFDIGKVGLARFANVAGLQAIGGGHFKETQKSGPAIIGGAMEQSFGQVIQGHLEASNTNITDELTKLMRSQQAFSASSRLMQAATDVSKRLIG